MKTIYTLSLSLALIIVLIGGATMISKSNASAGSAAATSTAKPAEMPVVEAEPMQASPFPDITVPGVPSTGNCCLTQLEKRVQGTRKVDFTGVPYACPTGGTQRGVMKVEMQIVSPGGVCDPLLAVIPNNSKLVATGHLIRRNDGFAHYLADFAILNPAGTTLFKGTMETIDRIGTHHLFFNCEQCNSPSHFEGWIMGRGTAAVTANFAIRAMIVSRGTVPSPAVMSTPMTGSLNGTLIKCP